jgi:hypothetical protein
VYTRTASRTRRPQRGGRWRGVPRGVPRGTSRGWNTWETARPARAGTPRITDHVSSEPAAGVAGTAAIRHIGSAGASGGARSAMAQGMQVIPSARIASSLNVAASSKLDPEAKPFIPGLPLAHSPQGISFQPEDDLPGLIPPGDSVDESWPQPAQPGGLPTVLSGDPYARTTAAFAAAVMPVLMSHPSRAKPTIYTLPTDVWHDILVFSIKNAAEDFVPRISVWASVRVYKRRIRQDVASRLRSILDTYPFVRRGFGPPGPTIQRHFKTQSESI